MKGPVSGDCVIKHNADKTAGAIFSTLWTHRYLLTRNFTEGRLPDARCRWLNVLLLNPSIASHEILDPTVKRQIARAKLWGYTGLVVTNIFAYRATDPSVMKRYEGDAVGEHNDVFIVEAAKLALESGGIVLAGWGIHGLHQGRGAAVRALLKKHKIPAHYLKLTGGGEPRHPLYIAYAVKPKLMEL